MGRSAGADQCVLLSINWTGSGVARNADKCASGTWSVERLGSVANAVSREAGICDPSGLASMPSTRGGLPARYFDMASIPYGSLILDLEAALSHFPQWTASDRAKARTWIELTGVTDFYLPPSGGYVAGHGGPNRSAHRDIPVNGIVMHVGYLHAWPNDADIGGDERIGLSSSREPSWGSTRQQQTSVEPTQVCTRCHLVVPGHLDECDNCGLDFVAEREACKERWRLGQSQRAEDK